jgi:hypothetical protein
MTWALFVIGAIVVYAVFAAIIETLHARFVPPTAQVSTGPKDQRPAGTPTSRPE